MAEEREGSEERYRRFFEALRGESKKGPGRGVGRVARLLRGGTGLAASVYGATRRGAEASLSERDLRRIEAMVTRVGELKGLPMKMGQIMSYLELELPEDARRLMGLLQTQAPATPWERVERIVREDLGERAEPLLRDLDRSPVSVASIGQVHRARLPDGADVAVKVRHPDIEDAIRADFRTASVGSAVAGLVPGMGQTVREFVGELEARLLEECDYELEADRQEEFAAIYAGHPVVTVPQVHRAFSGHRVLTTSWQPGEELEAFRLRASQAERDAAGAALFDFYVGTLYRNGLFHADPHPGNYHFRGDGRVVVFDYGCVRRFEPEVARAFVALAEAVRADDRARIAAALRRLGAAPSDDDAAWTQLRRLLRSFFGPMLHEGPRPVDGRIVIDMATAMRDKLAVGRLRLPGRLAFLFRIRFGLFAVLSRLGSVCDWADMERGFARDSGLLPA